MSETGVISIVPSAVDAFIHRLERDGWKVLVFPRGATDCTSFLELAKQYLPLSPPLTSRRIVWDAFSDSLWSGIHELSSEKVLIVWHGHSDLKMGDPNCFERIRETFHEISQTLLDPEYGAGKTVSLLVAFVEPD